MHLFFACLFSPQMTKGMSFLVLKTLPLTHVTAESKIIHGRFLCWWPFHVLVELYGLHRTLGSDSCWVRSRLFASAVHNHTALRLLHSSCLFRNVAVFSCSSLPLFIDAVGHVTQLSLPRGTVIQVSCLCERKPNADHSFPLTFLTCLCACHILRHHCPL